MLAFILVFLLVLVFCIYYLKIHVKYKQIDDLPGPPTKLFLGNLLDLGSNVVDTYNNFSHFAKIHGDLLRVWFGPFQPTIMIGRPEHIEYFLSSSVHITKSSGYEFLKSFLGNGLITSGGNYWRKHRKMITPTFHFKILEQFMEFITINTNTLVEKLKENLDKDIDIYPIIKMFALDTILYTAMNYNLNTMTNDGSDYMSAVSVYMEIFIRRFYSVFMRIDFLFKWTKHFKEREKALTVLREFTENIIKTRRAERCMKKTCDDANKKEEDEFGVKKKTAFLDLLLDIADAGQNLSDDEIREEVDTFVFAGHDTIATTTSLAIFELSKLADIQQKIYEESVEIIGEDINIPITYRNIQDLKYLEMVVKECLRYNSTVPLVERVLETDVDLDGLHVPAGTQIMIMSQAIHNNPELFPNPRVFDPERFSAENTAKRHPYAFIPFSAGPRNCIGQKFAILEVKMALVTLIRNFHIKPVVPEHKLILGSDAVLKSINGMRLILSARK